MKRRDFLKVGSGGVGIGLVAGCAASTTAETPGVSRARTSVSADVFIPGYKPQLANFRGQAALDHRKLTRNIPRSYDGNRTLLTKFSLDGTARQAVFPVAGHDVEISADGRFGVFGAMEADHYVTFDPKTLDLIAMGRPVREGWNGGGHGVFLAEGDTLAVSERAPRVGYLGTPDAHYGRVSFRDPKTLKILDSISTHGISPHEIRVLNDGKTLCAANYGSTYPKGGSEHALPRHVVEPSITLIDIASGQLVEKYFGRAGKEMRHLCVHDAATIFGIQARIADADDARRYYRQEAMAYEADISARKNTSFLPAATVRVRAGAGKVKELGSRVEQQAMRHGLSIEYEPRFDEVISSYPASHSLLIFDAMTGETKTRIDTAKFGLDYPCGIALLPNADLYVVAGYWKNLYVFERGTHELVRELCHYPTLFGHSHITAA